MANPFLNYKFNMKYCVELKQVQIPEFIRYLNKVKHNSTQYHAHLNKEEKVLLSPWSNEFEIEFEDTKYTVTMKEEGKPIGADDPKYYRRVKIYNDDKEKLRLLIEKALTYEEEDDSRKIKVFSGTSHGYWDVVNSIYSQSLEKIFVPQKIKDDLIKSIDDFIANEGRYIEYGRNYKLSILLTGVMGSGKSSIVKSIASKYKRRVYNISFTKGLTDEKFISLVNGISDNSIMLIEDIDAFFIDRKAQDINISFSALINIIDGLLSSGNGLIVFMTANHPEQLDLLLSDQDG